ncbi:MAG: acetyl-coenzyme A synthetase N-terminal domain-containing protein, partial [Opitutae bacterium]
MSDQQMDTVLAETRKFSPPEDFSSKAHIQTMEDYKALHQRSIQDPEGFWSEVASELHWFRKWDTVLNDDDKPFFKWFEGGKTNISYNCLDRHLDGPNRDKPALIWEGDPGE